ncbi:hypothetical protein D7216_08110 [Legionella pneumophila]|uniref:Methyltransferase FkbM domain-containing protein n=3 Tax=Gammaproteobacteria TaxID=1236 RepID=A0A2S6F933_LEGPN|nr:hypothetical protein BIZ52_15320 [Legionella pneumophila subsp. fraseri]AUB70081.1 hypothetical protein BJK09_15115 [Legionella pneumophila]CAH17121.1 hypothetical protein lpl2877 [Legionella pneumophila str. Lens]AUB73056.1 hypothetical protein BJK08_15110 [Legionella pneumophila]KXB24857.1 hypothetical protein PtVF66_10195 [Legionella pneumophila]
MCSKLSFNLTASYILKTIKSNLFNILCICFSITIIILLIKSNKVLNKKISQLQQQTFQIQNSLLAPIHENLVELLKVYSARDENGPLELVRHGKENDGGYVAAVKAFKQADVLLGYGIHKDNSFEDQFSLIYNKPSYGFDCGIEQVASKSKLFTLVKECIVSDAFLYNPANTNHKVTSFVEQLDNLNIKDKKLFIKMDIEGAEYDAFSGIMKHKDNITGIALEIHFNDARSTQNAITLLEQLEKHFVLIHVHGNNYAAATGFSTTKSLGTIPNVIELSYINKALVKNYNLSENQSHPLKIDQPNNPNRPDAAFTIIN